MLPRGTMWVAVARAEGARRNFDTCGVDSGEIRQSPVEKTKKYQKYFWKKWNRQFVWNVQKWGLFCILSFCKIFCKSVPAPAREFTGPSDAERKITCALPYTEWEKTSGLLLVWSWKSSPHHRFRRSRSLTYGTGTLCPAENFENDW